MDEGAERVVLFGASMGGGIVAAFLERSDRADVVAGIVLDAPMLDLDATVDHGAAQRELPVVGALPDGLTSIAEWIADRRFDLDWAAVDHLRGLARGACPGLPRHGRRPGADLDHRRVRGRSARPRAGRPRRGRGTRAVVERRSARLRAARVGLPRLRHGAEPPSSCATD